MAEQKQDLTHSSTQPETETLQEVELQNEAFRYVGTAIKALDGTPNAVLTIDNFVKHGFGLMLNKEEGTVYEG